MNVNIAAKAQDLILNQIFYDKMEAMEKCYYFQF